METPTVTAERLRALAELYEQGQVSDLMERTLAKLLRQEADVCQVQSSTTRRAGGLMKAPRGGQRRGERA